MRMLKLIQKKEIKNKAWQEKKMDGTSKFLSCFLVPFQSISKPKISFSPVSSNVLSSQRSVCTQLCFVWLFSTVVTTSLRVLDCDQGLEGRLIMDPTLACPLANPTKQPDADPAPAVLGITMLGIYALGILAFLGVAIKLAFSSAKKRSLEFIKLKKMLRLKKKRERRSR